ncbi:Y-family DNA polymerase [Pseudoalteromonas aurantia]|uniref:Protein ImuB n=1 Tax=Pseudoalteromonas aurantia 208 TaxID=1314867 RepID=A0ABR9EBK5_9GAMM|nr:DNA polymerase Y family protein [Pseudoalteromonas aurantia]MBE0368369.1 protein ImuB [Pseudoalteromonas aurantia 208]
MTLWVYLHFNSLQLDSLFCEQAHQPIIIVEGKDNRVVQACTKAQTAGITIGQGLGAAASLCQNLQVQPYNKELEQEKLKEIAHSLYTLTSDICFFADAGLLLRVSNMLSLYQGLHAYWQSISTLLNRLGFNYCYACGYSPLAARLLARNGMNKITDDHVLLLRAVRAHALHESDLPHNMSEQLTRVGVHTLDALLSIPMVQLAKRFDAELVHYVGRLLGHFKHPVNFYQPPERFSRELELLFELENISWLSKPLNKLLLQLEDFLSSRNKIAYQINITLQQRDCEALVVTVQSKEGEYKATKWLALSELAMSNVQLDAPIQGLSLQAKRITAYENTHGDLFSKQQKGGSRTALLSILQAKLGEHAIHTMQVHADHRPEKANSSVTLGAETPDLIRDASFIRPTIMLPFPEILSEKVIIQQGPERISTGWWDAQPIIRDYFIARDPSGRWLWVFRDPTQQWFVHGVFH